MLKRVETILVAIHPGRRGSESAFMNGDQVLFGNGSVSKKEKRSNVQESKRSSELGVKDKNQCRAPTALTRTGLSRGPII